MILHTNTTSQLLTCRERKTVDRECGRSTGAPFPITVTDFVTFLSCDKNHLSLLPGILPVLVHSIPQTNLLGEFPRFAIGDSGTTLSLVFLVFRCSFSCCCFFTCKHWEIFSIHNTELLPFLQQVPISPSVRNKHVIQTLHQHTNILYC